MVRSWRCEEKGEQGERGGGRIFSPRGLYLGRESIFSSRGVCIGLVREGGEGGAVLAAEEGRVGP